MKRKVLLCVLDWGLGHSTRSLALLRRLEHYGHEVVIASSGRALTLLKLECPRHQTFELPSYDVHYGSASFELGILRQLRKIFRAIKKEHATIQEIVSREKIDIIISDNRYGCYHKAVRSIFLSHHLRIRLSHWRTVSGIVNRQHKLMIGKFDECWVPDFPDHRLSGDLSKTSWSNVNFIGPLTTMARVQTPRKKKYDVLAVVSGPEPQRTIFSKALAEQLNSEGRYLLVQGQPGRSAATSSQEVSFMSRRELNEAIAEAEIVVTRPGYSTIMDLAAVGGSAIFVPTPGQTEQIYLAEQLERARVAPYQTQDRLDLRAALQACAGYTGFEGSESGNDLLDRVIQDSFANLK